MTNTVRVRTSPTDRAPEPSRASDCSAGAVDPPPGTASARFGATGRCAGSLVVYDDGAPAFCTAGCKLKGTADALVRHRRFVPGTALAPAFACLLLDEAPLQPLTGRRRR